MARCRSRQRGIWLVLSTQVSFVRGQLVIAHLRHGKNFDNATQTLSIGGGSVRVIARGIVGGCPVATRFERSIERDL